LDLSRWEDWSVLDRIVEMFKNSDAKGYVRQPVVSYLTVASEQPGDVGIRAKAAMAELEKLDPETVKTARSLMAFGALGRARGMATAANSESATTGAKPVAEKTSAVVNDPKQGFAASAIDDKVDAKQIPDPAGYGIAESPGEKANGKAVVANVTENRPRAEAVSPAVASVGRPAVSAHLNPLLVAGVPLGAAVLLMGVYWLILRAGAV
jgi:hypothetical protein